eukprot:364654-Chlamydomonas_euryale.AAC.7
MEADGRPVDADATPLQTVLSLTDATCEQRTEWRRTGLEMIAQVPTQLGGCLLCAAAPGVVAGDRRAGGTKGDVLVVLSQSGKESGTAGNVSPRWELRWERDFAALTGGGARG